VRITANQVTLARIFLLPVPTYMLIYGESIQWWVAFAIFVILGATDFIDGWMARKEGPTRLGSLIDPVADKIFVAALLLSLTAIGVFPSWVISVLLSREFLMTALRSSVAYRRQVFKTSVLAKLKTVIQMGGLGTIFFTISLSKEALSITCILLALLFVLIAFIYIFRREKIAFWVLPVLAAFILVAILARYVSKDTNIAVQMGIIIALTWISALDYLIGSFKMFRSSGIGTGDFVRLLWSITFGLFVVPLVAYYPVMVLPLLVCISLEFGLGGIDNIVVAERNIFSSLPFVLTSIAGLIFALGINFSLLFSTFFEPLYMAIILASISALVCGALFGHHVDLFKRSLRDI
jgi:CDP-diacylglycerol--glycerol-3-phosphate 3-phosphatidyltransferase